MNDKQDCMIKLSISTHTLFLGTQGSLRGPLSIFLADSDLNSDQIETSVAAILCLGSQLTASELHRAIRDRVKRSAINDCVWKTYMYMLLVILRTSIFKSKIKSATQKNCKAAILKEKWTASGGICSYWLYTYTMPYTNVLLSEGLKTRMG